MIYNLFVFSWKVLIMSIILHHVTILEDNVITHVLVYKLRIFAKSFVNAVANAKIDSRDADARLNATQNNVHAT